MNFEFEIVFKAGKIFLSEGIVFDKFAVLLRYYFVQDLLGSVGLIAWLTDVIKTMLAEEFFDKHFLKVGLVSLLFFRDVGLLFTTFLANP